MHHVLAGLAVAGSFALGVAATPSSPQATPVLTFDDPAIVEASDLVVTDGLFVTTNDSGDTGRVFAVDHTGHTVGVSYWSKQAVDVEALAPAGPGEVWVGDIGDNLGQRPSVVVARVPVGRGGERSVHPTTYRLGYPDGASDAETLLRDPATGRLYIATKNVFGGVLYAAPERLSPTGINPLTSVGRVMPLATDGSFFPDGRHLIIRNYERATVYAWPSLQPVGSFGLPAQRQGEGIAVAADGSVYLSSEGPRSTVLKLSLPTDLQRLVTGVASDGPPAHSSPPADSAPAAGAANEPAEVEPTGRDAWPWMAGGLLAVVALVVLVRAVRPR
jgi:hypothetical protein